MCTGLLAVPGHGEQHSAPVSSGLSQLDELLPAAKARKARLWVCRGLLPEPEWFDRHGLSLSHDEAARLQQWLEHGLVTRLAEEVRSSDGTLRLVLALRDGQRAETVAMPSGSVCVSTQLGCAVGCRFCASGLLGLARNLTVEEIVEQVVHARRRMPIDRVLYMGMGEPTHNLEAVLEAVARLKADAAIGPRRQTLSTVGSLKAFERLSTAEVKPCLAFSLHCADEAKRRELLVRAPKDPLRDLIAAADRYGRSTTIPVQFEWTLLAGVNDSDADIDQLVDLLRGVRCLVNFIVWNPVAGMPFTAPSRERIVAIVRRVKAGGVLATIRDSAGPDADAACGQLRLRRVQAETAG
jgi:23S rRNA (adenine2503-C2)-methyltransferase